MQNKLCSNCGETLICGANQTTEACWCFTYPFSMPSDSQQDCLCEECLSASVQEKIVNSINNSSQKDVIAVAEKISSENC
jgi:hypothetical protein